MPVIGFILYAVLGIAQIAAFMEGAEIWLGLGPFVSVILAIVILGVIPMGAILTSLLAFYGAYRGWHWEWWQAGLLAFPFVILQLVLMGAGGAAALINKLRPASTA